MEKEEYELTLFGFSVEQISVERRCLLKKIMESTLDSVLRNRTEFQEVTELLAEAKMNIIENILNKFKQNLNKLYNLDVKYFSIPTNVLLPNDFNLAKNYTKEDEEGQNAQLEHLKQEFLENSVWLELLKLECNRYKILEDFVSAEGEVQQQLQQLTDVFDMKKFIALVNITESITH